MVIFGVQMSGGNVLPSSHCRPITDVLQGGGRSSCYIAYHGCIKTRYAPGPHAWYVDRNVITKKDVRNMINSRILHCPAAAAAAAAASFPVMSRTIILMCIREDGGKEIMMVSLICTSSTVIFKRCVVRDDVTWLIASRLGLLSKSTPWQYGICNKSSTDKNWTNQSATYCIVLVRLHHFATPIRRH